MTYRRNLSSGLLLAGLYASSSSLAYAQDSQDSGQGGLQAIVVTARKQSENVQKIPQAISAIGGTELQRLVIRTPADLQSIVPSLRVDAANPQQAHGAFIGIRGQLPTSVLVTFSTPVGVYEDSVNIPHAVGVNLGFVDIARIEVLKGPQGTLYGRNTTAGAVNIITRNADYDGIHGYTYLEGGSFGDMKGNLAVNVPVVDDKLAVRFAYQYWNREGFGKSELTGQRLGDPHNDHTVRASIRFDPSPAFTASLKAEYDYSAITGAMLTTPYITAPYRDLLIAEWENEGRPGGIDPVTLTNTPHSIFRNYTPSLDFDRVHVWHAVGDATWHLSDDVDLRSISGYHQFSNTKGFNLAGLNVIANDLGIGTGGIPLPGNTDTRPLLPDQQSAQFSQEFDLSARAFDNRLRALAGVFYSRDTGNGSERAAVLPTLFGADFDSGNVLNYRNRSIAIFTQNDFHFNDKLSVTFGGRYTWENLRQHTIDDNYILAPIPTRYLCSAGPNNGSLFADENDCAFSQSVSSSGYSYLFSLNYQINPGVLVYAKTARGFRGSALQSTSFGPPLKPETVTDYEIGIKADLLDRHLRINADIYDAEYKNKQEAANEAGPGGSLITFITSAGARIRGAELELTAIPVNRLTLTATGAYLDGRYRSFTDAPNPVPGLPPVDASGTSFINNPKWTYNLGAHYTIPAIGPGDLSLQTNYAWRSRLPTTPLNDETIAGVPADIQKRLRAPVGLLSANIEYALPKAGVTFSVFATNLLDKHYQLSGTVQLPQGPDAVTQAPRMIGVSIRKSFGRE